MRKDADRAAICIHCSAVVQPRRAGWLYNDFCAYRFLIRINLAARLELLNDLFTQ